VVIAETDDRARFLATTHQQLFLNLIRNHPGPLQPPVERLQMTSFEEVAVRSKARAAVIGSPETARRKLEALLQETQVDELMVVTNTYEHQDRLRSYELLAGLAGKTNANTTETPVHAA
jgi:alkanesulfonate monooxygenase SsuD/methylene tetrahydromethanopterin reductase-like flavin-dependent oxidoreductase (luciferase family)